MMTEERIKELEGKGFKRSRKERTKMKQLDWKREGGHARGFAPMLWGSRCELGKDKAGKMWLCQATPQEDGRWQLRFDTDEEGEDFPFLRDEVLEADYYSKACRERYSERYVAYKQITDTIVNFMGNHGIQ